MADIYKRFTLRSPDIALKAADAVADLLPVNPEHPYVVTISREARNSGKDKEKKWNEVENFHAGA